MAKTARKWTLEELKEKAKPALAVEELILIVINQPQDKINLSQVDQQAFEYVFRKTNDLQKAKKLSKAARFLAMMRRDYPVEGNYFSGKEFSKEFQETKKPELKPEPKDKEIELVGDMIFSTRGEKFLRIYSQDFLYSGMKMAAELLEIITNVKPKEEKDSNFPRITWRFLAHFTHNAEELSEAERLSALRNYLIQVLEEKFGMKIRICGNCENYDGNTVGKCKLNGWWREINFFCDKEQWTPKEISEEEK